MATLRAPGYAMLWTASLLWNQARWMDQVVLGWTVLELTNSAWQVALIGVLRSLPMMLLGVLGGAIADRFERRRLLIGAQALGASVSISIGVLLWFGALRYEHAVIAALLLGVQWAVDWPARRALIPDLVGRDLTQSAIVLESVSMNLTRIVGPLVAGALIAFASSATSYFVMGLLYAAEIYLLAVLPLPHRAPRLGSTSIARYVREGFDELRLNHPIVGVLLITVFMNAFAFPYQQILSVFARDVLQVDPIGLGILGAASGVGALCGALVLSARPFVPRPALLFSIGSFAMSAAVVGFALSRSFELSVALLLLSGLGSSTFSAFQSTIILRAAPEQVRGRAMGVLTLAIGTAHRAAFMATAALCAVLIVTTAAALPRFRRAE